MTDIDLCSIPLYDATGGQAEPQDLISPTWLPREELIVIISISLLFYLLLTFQPHSSPTTIPNKQLIHLQNFSWFKSIQK